MKIVYIEPDHGDNSGLSAFLAEQVAASATDPIRLKHTGDDAELDPLKSIAKTNADLIVIFELAHLARRAVEQIEGTRIVFVPMYDSAQYLGDAYWGAFCQADNALVFNFNDALHVRCRNLGVKSFRFQYFANPKLQTQIADFSTLKAVHIQGRDAQSVSRLSRRLSEACETVFELDAVDVSDLALASSDALADYNIWASPEECSGLDVAMLEAMAAGMCVVVPDTPANREYVTHDVNGILYDPDAFGELDLSDAEIMGRNAKRFTQQGYEAWTSDLKARFVSLLSGQMRADAVANCESALWAWSDIWTGEDVTDGKPRKRSGPVAANSDLPKVTVAMVCYNVEDKLSRTLQTIILQEYPNMEVIVIDGASTDGTASVLSQYKDNIDLIVSEEDSGPYDAMNKAARMGSGEYIIYMNAGDYFYAPQSLSTAINNTLQSGMSHPDIIIGHHLYVYKNGATSIHQARTFDETWQRLQEGNLDARWFKGMPCGQSVIIRRELLITSGGFDLNLKIAADHDVLFRLKQSGHSFAHSNSTLSIYVGGGISSHNALATVHESWASTARYAPYAMLGKARDYYVKSFGEEAVIRTPESFGSVISLILDSGLFWSKWYRMKNRLGPRADEALIAHYLSSVRYTLSRPNPFFDPAYYLTRHANLLSDAEDPLVHYIKNGAEMGLSFRDETALGELVLPNGDNKIPTLSEIADKL